MPKLPRPKVVFLPQKLLQVRLALRFSQSEMLSQLGLADSSYRSAISGYELGTREPALPILLRYAKLAGICVDLLIDDELLLPVELPTKPVHQR